MILRLTKTSLRNDLYSARCASRFFGSFICFFSHILPLLLPTTIGKYFEYARGTGTDLYVVKHFTDFGDTVLAKGYVPTGNVENAKELFGKQNALIARLDAAHDAASAHISAPTKIFQSLEGEYATVFAPCKDGQIGCGWYDHAGTQKKGLKLAAFFLYALGLINAKEDPVLWEATYKYLPYDSELGHSEIAERIIFDTMREAVLKKNEAPRLTRLPNNNG